MRQKGSSLDPRSDQSAAPEACASLKIQLTFEQIPLTTLPETFGNFQRFWPLIFITNSSEFLAISIIFGLEDWTHIWT